jgi:aldose sugar dehydrogenase
VHVVHADGATTLEISAQAGRVVVLSAAPLPLGLLELNMHARAQLVVLILALQLASCGSPSPPAGPPSGSPPPADSPQIETFTTADGVRVGVQVVATRLEIPWALAFAPDGRLFVTERPGRVRILQNGTLLPEPALTISDVFTGGESGILGLALHPSFASNRLVYLVYTAVGGAGPVARLVRYRELANALGEPAVLLDDVRAANIHNGSRVRFGPDGALYVTFGDVATPSAAQDLGSLNGKILRLSDDGTTPPDNPFRSPVWSWGHRNPQGLDWHPGTGDLFEAEHGATGNDEINVIDRGRNYGWPIIEADASRPDMQTPIAFFTPSVAPSGASFYRGAAFPAFRNDLFVATLAGRALLRVRLDPANPRRVQSIERLLENRFGRLRDVVSGPDGYLYIATNNRDGRGAPASDDDRILRLVPLDR